MISKASLRPLAASTLMAAAILACLVEPAFAQAAGIETVLQNIVDMLTGNIARLLAVIAVIIICIAWMF
ncbi:TrbC/VirB2 family protein, partial [Rhizobium phaseoli]